MATIYSAQTDKEGNHYIGKRSPDDGAEVGRWCKAPHVPDQCDTCYDPRTLTHYPATGYVEDSEGWRYGTCDRCRPERPAGTPRWPD
jgi:hypothetical protein